MRHRRFRRPGEKPWLRRVAVALGLLVTLLLGGGYTLFALTFPKTAGELALPGLEAPVTVSRDAMGIPTITAAHEADGYFALGFVHAQDRFFQMELMRRVGAGRLSEILGTATLGTDRYMRTLGLYRLAEAQAEAASPAFRRALDAYAAGVNAWIGRKGWPWTPELLLLDHTPEPWRPSDSLVWGKLMAVQLSNNWRYEALRLRLAQVLTPEQIDDLWPDFGPAPGAVKPPQGPIGRALPPMENPWDFRTYGGPSSASNAWALSGDRTLSGLPFLANDPHLGFRAPILWYLAKLDMPGLTLSGATVPGVPMMVVGHNGDAAWGFTTTGADTEDLFLEQADPGAPDHYRTPDGPRPFEVRDEVIKVKGEDDEVLKVRATRHGPILSDASDNARVAGGDDHLLALSAAYLRADDKTPEALFALNRARDWPAFKEALKRFHSPVQNVFYAGRDGRIAMISAGRIPIRIWGDGRWPAKGYAEGTGWRGFIPFEALPRHLDPDDGAILNANQAVTDPDHPHLITRDWDTPHRAIRINELILKKEKANSKDWAAHQADTLSVLARELLPILLEELVEDAAPAPEARTALETLKTWDLRLDIDGRAPVLFNHWLFQLKHALFADETRHLFSEWRRPAGAEILHVLRHRRAWCDNVATAGQAESCRETVTAAFKDALAAVGETDKQLGRPALWGDVHQARFEHPVFSRLPALGKAFTLSVPTAGGDFTLNRGAMWGPTDAPDFTHRHGAGLRAAFDLADPGASRFAIATGQSGNPLSPHYSDFLELWAAGGSVTIAEGGPEEGRRLILKPAAGLPPN